MKVATWNVNGIRARSREVQAWLARHEPDVACLQEIRARPDQVPGDVAMVPTHHAHWHGHGGYSGVALLLRKDRFAAPTFTHPPFDLETRIVVAESGSLVVASVYVPNGGKDFVAKMRFLHELESWAGALEAAGRHLVLCGDLNVARTDRDVHPIYRRPIVGQLPEERAVIDELFAHGLADVGRLVAPDDERLFTWWAPWRNMRARNIGWRLDYVAASRALVGPDVTCVVERDVGTSDHGPVVATLRDVPSSGSR